MSRGGWKHSQDARERIAASNRANWDADKRAAVSAATKARMADPAVRQRIKDGMQVAAAQVEELRALRALWRATSSPTRVRFITELLSPVSSASAPHPIDRTEAQ